MSRSRPRIPAGLLSLHFASTNVAQTAVQLSASLGMDVNHLEINDTSNTSQGFQLLIGPSGSEVVVMSFPSGAARSYDCLLNKGMRITIKSISGTASTGDLMIQLSQ